MTTQDSQSASQISEQLLALLKSKLGEQIKATYLCLDAAVVEIDRPRVLEFFRLLKLDSQLQFNFFIDVTAIDWVDQKSDRFELVYHLMSLAHRHRLRVKVGIPEQDPTIDTVSPLWSAANFMEREVWDMYGITFRGHPDLRRILMYDEFVGYPLRKDYPVQGKQPRVALRMPEVRNTAVDMVRPALVHIRPRTSGATGNGSGEHR